MTTSRTAFMALWLAAMGGWTLPAMAEPLPGLWERRFTAFMSDAVSGEPKPWAEPADVRCLSEAELRRLPFLTAGASKAAFERDASTCTVSDEVPTRAGASWRLSCKENSGRLVETRMSVEISDASIVSTTLRAAPDQAAGAREVRAEVRLARLGNCESGAAKKP